MSQKNVDKDSAQTFIEQTPDAKCAQTEANTPILSHLSLRCFSSFRVSELKALGREGGGCLRLSRCPRTRHCLLKGHDASGDATAKGPD